MSKEWCDGEVRRGGKCGGGGEVWRRGWGGQGRRVYVYVCCALLVEHLWLHAVEEVEGVD